MTLRVVIVGGGTAGWMTAAYLCKKTDWDLTIIQSEDIPVIGVGESTLPSIYTFITELGLTEQDLFDDCDAVRKYTICHKNWHHAPWWHHFCSDESQHSEQLQWMDNYELPDKKWRHSYHIDANKFSTMLRDKVAIPSGVKIQQRTLQTVDDIEADYIIDCTGFNRLFPEKKYVKTRLKNNRAIVAPSYDRVVKYYTETTAMDAGWMWNIYLQNRIGNGYVFSDSYQSVRDAKREFIEKCPYNLEVEEMRVLDWESKYCPVPWSGKTISIGLSAGFIEPLEATSIWLIQYQIEMLVRLNFKDRAQDVFNKRWSTVMKQAEDFLHLHYTAVSSTKRSTDYWKQYDEIDRIIISESESLFKNYSYRCLANGYDMPC